MFGAFGIFATMVKTIYYVLCANTEDDRIVDGFDEIVKDLGDNEWVSMSYSKNYDAWDFVGHVAELEYKFTIEIADTFDAIITYEGDNFPYIACKVDNAKLNNLITYRDIKGIVLN